MLTVTPGRGEWSPGAGAQKMRRTVSFTISSSAVHMDLADLWKSVRSQR